MRGCSGTRPSKPNAMLFTSGSFLVFLPVVFSIYWFLCGNSRKWQNIALWIASYVFYAWWNWKFLGLLMLSTLIDYSFAFLVYEGPQRRRKLFLTFSMVNNLLVLGIFKYFNFFVQETQHFLDRLGFHTN